MMVTVSNMMNNFVNKPVSYGSTIASNAKTYIDQNFQSKNTDGSKKNFERPKEDCLVDNTLKNRIKINWDKTTAIPLVHFPRGLGGAPDYTFFEFLQTAKFPYYVGGPILAALFYAGVKKDNFTAANSAKKVAKHMALGVGLYYLGAAVAKSIINKTVKASRGIDLNQPYMKVIPTSTNQTGVFKKDFEYHKVFESADFTRWDLLYNKEANDPKEINKTYSKIAKKYGIKDDANDVDSTVKPLIKKTIIMARAWQYALTAFYVTLGIGMANQKAWEKGSLEGFKKTITNGIFGSRGKVKDILEKAKATANASKTNTAVEFAKLWGLKERLHAAKVATYDYMIKPFGKSFMQFWEGHSKASSIAGKSVILATGAATLTAVMLLLGKTTGRFHKIQTKQNQNNEVKQ